VEPEEELYRFGDLLLGRVDRPARGRACCRLGADAAQVVPGGEMLHGLAHFVGESVELGIDPLLEPGEIGIALGK